MKHVMDMLKINEEIARKFLEVETALESAGNPAELLEILLKELGVVFDIPYVWLAFVNRQGEEGLPAILTLPAHFRERVGIVDEESFGMLLQQKTIPVLANENLRPFYKLFPRNRKYFIKSIAVVPLTLRGQLVGSVNLGDAIPERYSEGMDTSLLQQLAGRISERLDVMLYTGQQASAEPGTFFNRLGPGSGVSESE